MADLRQILSQGRKRIGLVIGAGAPMSIKLDLHGKVADTGRPLIPGVDELTSLVSSGLSEQSERFAISEIVKALCGRANIEQILSQVRLLERALGTFLVHGLNSEGYRVLGKNICTQIGKIVNAS